MKEKDIEYVFEQNPELAKIGTKTKYYKYLQTIFPDSKIKKIVYHHSNEKIEKFKPNFKESYFAKRSGFSKAIFFLGSPVKKEFLSKRPYLGIYILNSKNPLNYKNEEKDLGPNRKSGIKEGIFHALKNKNDAVIFLNIWDNKVWTDVYVVFNPKQIHTLGSKKDLREFKRYLKIKG